MFYLPMLCIKEPIKMARLHSRIRPSISTYPGFSGKKAYQNSNGIVLSLKIMKLMDIKVNEKSPWTGSY